MRWMNEWHIHSNYTHFFIHTMGESWRITNMYHASCRPSFTKTYFIGCKIGCWDILPNFAHFLYGYLSTYLSSGQGCLYGCLNSLSGYLCYLSRCLTRQFVWHYKRFLWMCRLRSEYHNCLFGCSDSLPSWCDTGVTNSWHYFRVSSENENRVLMVVCLKEVLFKFER